MPRIATAMRSTLAKCGRAALILLVLSGSASLAQDQNRARDAVRAGEVRPLAELLPQIRAQFDGRMLDAQLVRRGANPLYRLKILGRDGQVTEIVVDARTGAIRGARGARR